MYKSFGGKKSGGFSPRGGSGFGGKGGSRFGGGGGGKGDWKQLFDATCASCSQACQVPFKPNGRKPVLCSNCFKRDGGHESRGERQEFRKPAFGDRSEGGSNVAAQLKEINDKLDAIIDALEE